MISTRVFPTKRVFSFEESSFNILLFLNLIITVAAATIKIANDTDYGLASGVFTSDDQKAKWTADRIEAGIVWHNDWFVDGVNLPGGGYKKSGYGRDGGIDSLYSYGQTKRVSKRLH